ncbi:ferredoxin [Nocardioides sp. NBC_00163]|uniref:ferredoxin n=1 Tax=Nocardioides sp. NBC_00163 TaxID=2975999 RepID=UPI0032533FBE
MGMNVTIDRQACNGYGNCLVAAPDVFDIDPETNVAVLLSGKPDAQDDAAVLEAVADCPARALKAEARL